MPVQTAVWNDLGDGAPTVEVVLQESVAGSYLPPVLDVLPDPPPQTIISLPVQTEVWPIRGSGRSNLVDAQVSGEQGSAEISGKV